MCSRIASAPCGVGTSGYWYQPEVLEQFPVAGLDLFVHAGEPDFKAKGFVDENDGNFEIAIFEGWRREGKVAHIHIAGIQAPGDVVIRVFLLEVGFQRQQVFHQAPVGCLDGAFVELLAIFEHRFGKGWHG